MKHYHNAGFGTCKVDILLNKDRYIEFCIATPAKYLNELRLLFGPKVQRYSHSAFVANKNMLERVLKVLELKRYSYKVTEDWI